MREEAVYFGETGSLMGIVTTPSTAVDPRLPAFIFLNSGLLHRVGPNRLHVTMARDLAGLGLVSFRIDFSGIGDSPAGGKLLSVEERWVNETQEAMDYLMQTRNIKEFILVGNCSGADIGFLTAYQDSRVTGAVLVNLQGPETPLSYYLKLAFTSPKIWRRLLKGTAQYRDFVMSIREQIANFGKRNGGEELVDAIDVDAAIHTLAERQIDLFFIYCSWDPGLDYFNKTIKSKLHGRFPQNKQQFALISGMNHDFSLVYGQERFRHIVKAWASERLELT